MGRKWFESLGFGKLCVCLPDETLGYIYAVPLGMRNECGCGILIIIPCLIYKHCWKNHINCRDPTKLVVYKIVPMGFGCISSIIKPRVETLGYNNAVPLGLRIECGCGILEAIILVLIYRKRKSYKLSRSYKTCVS